MRLLIVEDDALIGEAVRTGLKLGGYTVDWVQDGHAAMLAIQNGVYDLVLLDLGLPRKDGLAVLSEVRSRGDSVPVLVLTARDGVGDRVKGLDTGADDYLVKPFDLDELAARVRALLRRRAGRGDPIIRHGRIMVDPVSHRVEIDGKALPLSPKEFALLYALIERPGAVLSREQLEERVYGWNEEISSNAIEVHLHNLRRKLGVSMIRNVRGVGYRIARPDEVDS